MNEHILRLNDANWAFRQEGYQYVQRIEPFYVFFLSVNIKLGRILSRNFVQFIEEKCCGFAICLDNRYTI